MATLPATRSQRVDRRQPAIAHGAYGCITASDDVGDSSVEALPGFSIQIFATEPPATPDDGLAPDAEAHSGKTGFYELELEPGSPHLLQLCAADLRRKPCQLGRID